MKKNTHIRTALKTAVLAGLACFALGTVNATLITLSPVDSSATDNSGAGTSSSWTATTFSGSSSNNNFRTVGRLLDLDQSINLGLVGAFIQFEAETERNHTMNIDFSNRIGFFNTDEDNYTGIFGARAVGSSPSGVYYQNGNGSFSAAGSGTANLDHSNNDDYIRIGDGISETIPHTGNFIFRIEYLAGGDLEVSLSGLGTDGDFSRVLAAADVPTYTFDSIGFAFRLPRASDVTDPTSTAAFNDVTITAQVIPEPGTLVLLGLAGVAGLIGFRRRRH